MVRTIFVTSLLLLLAAPAFAQQNDYPRIQQGFGYSNVGFPNGDGTFSHHSGFGMQTDLNLTRWLGVENFLGYYALATNGCGSQSCYLFAENIGGRVTYRMDRFSPYVAAGFGTGYYEQAQTNSLYGTILTSSSAANARFVVGADIPFNDTISWRVEAGRMSFHVTDPITGIASWQSNIVITGGIVFNLLY